MRLGLGLGLGGSASTGELETFNVINGSDNVINGSDNVTATIIVYS